MDLIYHPGLSNSDYHAMECISPSKLKVLSRSPLHYFDQFIASDREKQKPNDAMIIGTAFHTAVLEPELWDAEIAIKPSDAPLRPTEKQLIQPAKTGTKTHEAWLDACARRDWWEEFDKKTSGKLMLTTADADQVRRMADSVRSHPAARDLLSMPGRREASYTWNDLTTGLPCKTRPDYHSEDKSIVVDLKSTKDARRNEFSRSIAGFDYHIQSAWNIDAIGADQFITIAVESVRPFCVAVYPASDALIAAGRRRYEEAMDTLAKCYASGNWPGYGDEIHEPIDLPEWCLD